MRCRAKNALCETYGTPFSNSSELHRIAEGLLRSSTPTRAVLALHHYSAGDCRNSRSPSLTGISLSQFSFLQCYRQVSDVMMSMFSGFAGQLLTELIEVALIRSSDLSFSVYMLSTFRHAWGADVLLAFGAFWSLRALSVSFCEHCSVGAQAFSAPRARVVL